MREIESRGRETETESERDRHVLGTNIAHICIMNCLSTWHFRISIKCIDDLGGQCGEFSASGKM